MLLDVRGLTSIADFFFILSGRSHRQVSAIADHILKSLRDLKQKPLSAEGLKDGLWALLDYGDVVIHIFLAEQREFYDLDGLWIDAKRLIIDPILSETDNAPPEDENES